MCIKSGVVAFSELSQREAEMATVFSGLYSLSSAMLAFLSGRNRTNKPPPTARSGTELGVNSTGRRDSPSSEAAATFHNAEGESAV